MAIQQSARFLGVVTAIRKSFGFIRAAEFSKDIFFHSSACSDFTTLAVGQGVEFSVEQQQGKDVAVQIQPSTRQPELTIVDADEEYGIIGQCSFTGQQGSGYLRFMDQHGQVHHLTFTSQDIAAGLGAVSSGQLVKFHILTDKRQQLLHQNRASSGAKHAKHAYMRATQLQPVSADDKAALMPLQQQQLLVLEALSETFDGA